MIQVNDDINARTSGEAEVEVLKAVEKKLSNCWRNTILVGVLIPVLLFYVYLLIFIIPSEPKLEVKIEAPKPITKVIEEPKPVPKHLILIQTDESRKVLRHWEFKEAWISYSKHTHYWSIKTIDGSEIHMKPIQHFVLLENPTEETIKQFLVDEE
jgi:hypothetical protein